MSYLRRWSRLSSEDWKLFLTAFFLLAIIRSALWVVPYALLGRIRGYHLRPRAVRSKHRVGRLEWAILAASRRIPSASCLTQSVALHWLMARCGFATNIRIGVAKDSKFNFRAHAWVEHEGRPLLNHPAQVAQYLRLLGSEKEA